MNKNTKKPVRKSPAIKNIVDTEVETVIDEGLPVVNTDTAIEDYVVPGCYENPEVESLRQKLDASDKQISELKDMILKLAMAPKDAPTPVVADPFGVDRWITLVHLADWHEGLYTIFKGSNGTEYMFNYFGQTRKVKLLEFEDIISRHRKLFDRLLITISANDNDIAEAYNLPKTENILLKSHQLTGLVNMTEQELEDIYNKVCDTHRSLICRKWQVGYWERDEQGNHPKNLGYKNIGKVTLLNEISNGTMSHVLSDIEDRRKHRNS